MLFKHAVHSGVGRVHGSGASLGLPFFGAGFERVRKPSVTWYSCISAGVSEAKLLDARANEVSDLAGAQIQFRRQVAPPPAVKQQDGGAALVAAEAIPLLVPGPLRRPNRPVVVPLAGAHGFEQFGGPEGVGHGLKFGFHRLIQQRRRFEINLGALGLNVGTPSRLAAPACSGRRRRLRSPSMPWRFQVAAPTSAVGLTQSRLAEA